MSRPPTIPAEKKLRIVLSVLQGEVTVAEAARREKVSEQAIGNWKRQFLEGGKAGIEAGKSKPSTRERLWLKCRASLTPTRQGMVSVRCLASCSSVTVRVTRSSCRSRCTGSW